MIPLVLVQKTNTLTSDQVDTLLGGILSAMKMKWVVFWIFLGIGIVVLGLGVFMCIKSRALFQQAEGGAGGENKVNATGNDSASALMGGDAEE